MLQRFSLIIVVCFLAGQLTAQKSITLEDIWKDYTFYAKSVPGFNFLKDGKHYSKLQSDKIEKYDLTSGQKVSTILDGESLKDKKGFNGKISSYEFSEDETKVMIKSQSESIYRRSSKAFFHLYDLETKELTNIYDEGKIMYATLDPTGKRVAFVYDNNLYCKDLSNNKVTQITQDGEKNKIINGATDWVYEEEFAFAKAFFWSAEGSRIAFIRFDEREVPEFTMTLHRDEAYPIYETFKYPKVGEKNAEVSVHLYDVKKDKTKVVNVGDLTDMYIPRLKWTKDDNELIVFKMNRHQNHLQLHLINAKKAKGKVLLEEKNKYYIDITDDLTFLENGKEFIWTSEKDGYNQIYLYDMKGKEKAKLTKGDYDVLSMYGVDEKNKRVYFKAAKDDPMNHGIYSVDYKGKKVKTISPNDGSNSAQFSSTFDYVVITNSTANSPATYTVYDSKGKVVREIEDNEKVRELQKEYNVNPIEFFSFKTSEGVELNGWMIKPANFNENRRYPVFMTQYSGPGSQQVTNGWKGNNYWWYQMLAQNGYLVACIDPRGTGARGEEFKKMTYLQLGKYETIDQIEAAKYLGGLPYTDENRVGIFGWSYGGYMASNCIFKGSDVFKAAIAVAPVTNWKWYDTIYTERYMRTYAENKEGYEENSPVNFADRLKGSYLLCHGMADDNVHFQNAVEVANALIKANKQYDTYFYPNRNHGIYGDNARLHLYTKMTDFLYEKL